MSSSQTSADASRNRRRSRYFLVNSLADRLEEDSGQAKTDVSIDVANRAKVPLPDANLQPSPTKLLTTNLSGGFGASSISQRDPVSQASGAPPATTVSSASTRLVQGLMAEFQAVGLLPQRGSGDPPSPPPEPDILPQDWTVDAPQAPSLEQAEAIYDFDEADLFDASDLFEEVSGLDDLEAIAAFDALAQLAQQERAPVQPKPFEINASQISAPEIPAPESTAPESTIPESTIPESIAPESVALHQNPASHQNPSLEIKTAPPQPILQSPPPPKAPALGTPAPVEPAPVEPLPPIIAPSEPPVIPPVAPPPVAPPPVIPPVAPPPVAPPTQPIPENLPTNFIAPPPLQPPTPAQSPRPKQLHQLDGTQTVEGTVADAASGAAKTYKFSLSQLSDFNLVLEGMSADANVTLRDRAGNILQASHSSGTTAELIGTTLSAGDYQVEITAANAATDYRLVLSATPDLAGTANNLEVSAATYLGGNEHDTASAVEFSPQRELVVAGNFGMAAVGTAAERSLLGATLNSAGQIVRMSVSGQEVLSITHLGNTLQDMDVNRASGTIVAGGDFGVAVLNAAADQVLWSQDLGGEVKRVAIANNGTVVTLHDKTVSVWSSQGQLIAQQTLTRSYVEDVAIDPETGAIYVAGYDNKYNSLDNNPVQVAFLTGFDGNLNTQWSSWGYEADTLTDGHNDMADTRGYRVTIGRDGQLYYLGEVAGGNSIYRWNGKDRSTETLVKYDAYNDPYNSKSPHQTYYARINPETGEVLQGQLALARLSSGDSNAVRVYEGSITADEAGNVYIGGRAFSGVAGRDQQTINGEAVGEYAKADPFALVVSSDFQSRKNWTTFVKDGGQGTINGFAVGEGRAAIVGTINQGTVITKSALNPGAFNANDADKSDVYLATWGTDALFGGDRYSLDTGGAIADFSAGDHLQFSAKALGGGLSLGTLPESAFVLGSQPQGSQPTFLYANGLLRFDADGVGARSAIDMLTLKGNPSLEASQISITH